MRASLLTPGGLDPRTAERLLAGLPADDAPPGFAAVARVLALAAAPVQPDELDGEAAARSAYRRARSRIDAPVQPSRRTSMISRLKFSVAAAAGGLTLTTGLAAAGALPGAAQDVAAAALARVGIEVPGPNAHSNGHADDRGKSGDAHDSDAPEAGPTAHEPDGGEGQGEVISGIATTTDSEGVDKGAEISGVASDGQSQAGENGQAGEDHGEAGDHVPPDAGNPNPEDDENTDPSGADSSGLLP